MCGWGPFFELVQFSEVSLDVEAWFAELFAELDLAYCRGLEA